MRYCNSLRILVRASSLVGAVTSTWPVDDPACRASHLPLARRETVQVSFMAVDSGCQLRNSNSSRSSWTGTPHSASWYWMDNSVLAHGHLALSRWFIAPRLPRSAYPSIEYPLVDRRKMRIG